MEKNIIFIAGGTGFVGKRLITALLKKGYKLRCLVRSKENATALNERGVESVIGEISDRKSLKGAMKGVKTVVNLVGIIQEIGDSTYEKVHVEGNANLLRESVESGVEHYFYQSALGADARSWSGYLKSKAQAEELVKASSIPYTIFRPSLIVGGNDGFMMKIKEMISSISPVIPIPGSGATKFQPIFIDDWTKCFMQILDNPSALGRTFDIGGPEHLSYKRIVEMMAKSMGVTKPLISIPLALIKIAAPILGMATREQLRLLDSDNICSLDAVKNDFGFEPMRLADAIKFFE